jgi:histidine ammonia-lyase/tyrosine ammonia-lyase
MNIAKEILASDGALARRTKPAHRRRRRHRARRVLAAARRRDPRARARSRAGLEALAERGTPIYGVNTGFGEMVHNWVEDGAALQENLLRSHCAGVGEIFNREEARAMMVARINSLARGYSAIRPEGAFAPRDYVNLGITPGDPARRLARRELAISRPSHTWRSR